MAEDLTAVTPSEPSYLSIARSNLVQLRGLQIQVEKTAQAAEECLIVAERRFAAETARRAALAAS